MKHSLFLLVVFVLLSACTSKNVRTYKSGIDIVYNYNNNTITTDTIDNNIPLSVFVENDTVWFHSKIFDDVMQGVLCPVLIFENKETNLPSYSFDLESYSDYEYYTIINSGKFFNTNDFKKAYIEINHRNDSKDSYYYLDLDQFKHLNK